MGPARIMFIRHAEKPHEPPCENDAGVKRSGEQDRASLAVRGWQRAGALVHFFASQPELRPDAIFAAGIGDDSPSHRPKQTVMPLAERLDIKINEKHLKGDVKPLMTDVLDSDHKLILISWEHTFIPKLIKQIPDAPMVPENWCKDRFDIVWVLDRAGNAWTFSQVPQLLLAGDSKNPIPFKSPGKE